MVVEQMSIVVAVFLWGVRPLLFVVGSRYCAVPGTNGIGGITTP